MSERKLSAGEKHLLRLIQKDKGLDGYTPCSLGVWAHVAKLPDDLVEKIEVGFGGIARLTPLGETLLKYL